MVRFSAAHIQSIYPTAASIYISNSIKSEKESLIKKDLYKNKKLITEKTGIAAEYINARQENLFTTKQANYTITSILRTQYSNKKRIEKRANVLT